MHLNHTSKIKKKDKKQEAHQGGAGDGTARAIDAGEDGDGTKTHKSYFNLSSNYI